MVMEFMEHDLRSYLDNLREPLSLAEIKCVVRQLLSALAYMHERWVMHRDLKTPNILISNDGRACICDFGLARCVCPAAVAAKPPRPRSACLPLRAGTTARPCASTRRTSSHAGIAVLSCCLARLCTPPAVMCLRWAASLASCSATSRYLLARMRRTSWTPFSMYVRGLLLSYVYLCNARHVCLGSLVCCCCCDLSLQAAWTLATACFFCSCLAHPPRKRGLTLCRCHWRPHLNGKLTQAASCVTTWACPRGRSVACGCQSLAWTC